MLIGNAALIDIHHRPENSVTESELKSLLRRYNLRDSLIFLGKMSAKLHDPNTKTFANGAFQVNVPGGRVYVTQFQLAYIANLLLISGANDYKREILHSNGRHDWLILCDVCLKCVLHPNFDPNVEKQDMTIMELLLPLHQEQMTHQIHPLELMARSIVLFRDLPSQISSVRISEGLHGVFEKETGITIGAYFRIASAVYATARQSATFSIESLTRSTVNTLKDVLTFDQVMAFLNILSADYKKIRAADVRENAKLEDQYTKTRFNPLLIFPIVETDYKRYGDQYVIPSMTSYMRKAYIDIFWWFNRHFESIDRSVSRDYRNYFGELFEQYVGLILKSIFGDSRVSSKVIYAKGKQFFDWYVEEEDKYLLFEATATAFRRESLQTGKSEHVQQEVGKIVDAIQQCFKAIKRVEISSELSRFRTKRLVPIIVFYNVPFASGDLFKDLIKGEVEKRVEDNSSLQGMESFRYFSMGIEELEFLDSSLNPGVDLEKAFIELEEKGSSESLTSILGKHYAEGVVRSKFLESVFEKFWSKDLVSRSSKK